MTAALLGRHVAPRTRRWVVAIAGLLAMLATVLVPSIATAQSTSAQLAEAKAERARLQGLLGDSDEELILARAELEDVEERLNRARGELRVAEGELARADQALGDAETRRAVAEANLAMAEDLLTRAESDLAEEQETFVDQVLTLHKYGTAGRSELYLGMLRSARSPIDAATGLYRLEAVLDYQDAVVERVDQLRDDRSVLLAEAEESRVIAETERESAEATLAFVERLAAQSRTLAETVAAEEAAQRVILSRLEADRRSQLTALRTVEDRIKALEEQLRREQLVNAGGLLCPITPVWFQNDWGFPRSGGRTHKGTDMFADAGTPIIAIADGTIRRVDRTDSYRPGSNRGDLGGISVSYWINGNEYWYWAHMQGIASGIVEGGSVQAGQVIGWVGNTGNAYSTPPHAHVGRYLNGSATNPFPLMNAACN